MNRILVPHDFSKCADSALAQAISIAKKAGAELHIYHVAALHPYWEQLSESDRAAYSQSLDTAMKIRERLAERKGRAEAEGLSVKTIFTPGKVIECITDYTEKLEVDLLVIGTHGMSGVEEWILGSNAQKILRKVGCPVLSVKQGREAAGFSRLAFVSAFQAAAESPFEKLMDFAELFQAQITLVNMDEPGIFRDPEVVIIQAMESFRDLAAKRGIDCDIKRLPAGDLEQSLKAYVKENDIDLVCVPTHGRGSLARIFTSSIAEAVVNHLEKPVMTVLMDW